MNPTYITFVRHGQATHNTDFEIFGESAYFDKKNTDAQLTELGRNQALAINLNNTYDIIYCSPLSRCIDTLLLSMPTSVSANVLLDDRLMEPQGDCLCNRRKEREEILKNLPNNWNTNGVNDKNPSDVLKEGYKLSLSGNGAFLNRIEQVGKEMLEKHRGKRIIIFSHHDWIRGWFLIFQPWRIVSPKNCEVLHVTI